MNVLMVGDVVGQAGVKRLCEVLPSLKREYEVDFTIVNGENSANGNGILPSSASELLSGGADVITTGNHALRRREIYEYIDEHPEVIRPVNFNEKAPGNGFYIIDRPPLSVMVINVQGVVFMDNIKNPFDAMDEMLKTVNKKHIIVDFHAEATGEKLSLAHYLDGRVSLLAGTHTHVPTADVKILPGGTGYVTDIGMCGGKNSVLGVKSELTIERLRTCLPTRFENDPEDIEVNCILAEIDNLSGKTTKISRIGI